MRQPRVAQAGFRLSMYRRLTLIHFLPPPFKCRNYRHVLPLLALFTMFHSSFLFSRSFPSHTPALCLPAFLYGMALPSDSYPSLLAIQDNIGSQDWKLLWGIFCLCSLSPSNVQSMKQQTFSEWLLLGILDVCAPRRLHLAPEEI